MNADNNLIGSTTNYVFNEDQDDTDLLLSFRAAFSDLPAIDTKEQLYTLVNISEAVRTWYADYRNFRNVFLVKPEWLPNDPESIKLWQSLQSSKSEQKKVFRDWELRIEAKSKALKTEIELVRREKAKFFKNMDPLLIISSLTVNNLPVKDAFDIALEGDLVKREALINERVVAMQKRLYLDFKNGVFINPYLK